MYSVNGVSLDNEALGWIFRAPSKPLSELVKQLQSLHVPGRSGVVTTDATADAPVIALVVQTPREHLEDLYALFFYGGTLALTATPARSVAFQFSSVSNDGFGPGDAIVDATISVRLDGAFWRDTDVRTSTAAALAAGMTTVDVFDGISAPMEDALVKVIGPANAGLTVTDAASQSAFSFTAAIPAGKALVYNCADETAVLLDTPSSWTGGTDVSGQINFFGDRFRIVPFMPTATDPTTRAGRLAVTAAGVTAASKLQVQGQGAYLV